MGDPLFEKHLQMFLAQKQNRDVEKTIQEAASLPGVEFFRKLMEMSELNLSSGISEESMAMIIETITDKITGMDMKEVKQLANLLPGVDLGKELLGPHDPKPGADLPELDEKWIPFETVLRSSFPLQVINWSFLGGKVRSWDLFQSGKNRAWVIILPENHEPVVVGTVVMVEGVFAHSTPTIAPLSFKDGLIYPVFSASTGINYLLPHSKELESIKHDSDLYDFVNVIGRSYEESRRAIKYRSQRESVRVHDK